MLEFERIHRGFALEVIIGNHESHVGFLCDALDFVPPASQFFDGVEVVVAGVAAGVAEVHGEVDEKSWHLKQALVRRQANARKETKLFAELTPGDLNKDFIVAIALARGIAEKPLLGGMTLSDGDDWIWQFRKVDDRIQIVRRNIRFRANKGSPTEKAVYFAYTDSILFSLPIVTQGPAGGSVVDLTPVFMSDLAQISSILKGFMFAADRSTWAHIKNYKDNAELEVAATFASGSKYDYLLREKMVTTAQLQKAFGLAKRMGKSVEYVLIETHKIKKEAIGKSFSLYYGCKFRPFDASVPAPVQEAIQAGHPVVSLPGPCAALGVQRQGTSHVGGVGQSLCIQQQQRAHAPGNPEHGQESPHLVRPEGRESLSEDLEESHRNRLWAFGSRLSALDSNARSLTLKPKAQSRKPRA